MRYGTRTARRKGTKFHVCPSCAVASKGGQSVWGYHGKSGARELVQHRVRAHGYTPRAEEQELLRRFV